MKAAILLSVTVVSLTNNITSYKIANADTINSNECYPAVLMLRGSAEIKVSDDNSEYMEYNKDMESTYIKTNGLEGQTISELVQSFVNQTNPSQTVSKVRFIGIDYPALTTNPTIPENDPNLSLAENSTLKATAAIDHLINYHDSYNQGAQNIVDFINSDTRQGCDTRYMLVGYSQGVLSARLAMNLLDQNNDKVISTYSIGDPFQKANKVTSNRQYSQASTGKDGTGIYRKALEYLMNIEEYDPNDPDDKAKYNLAETFANADHMIYRDEGAGSLVSRSICHHNDMICDFDWKLDMSEHLNYFQDNPDIINDSGEIDLAYEISEFDKQVQTLAKSTSYNPRERVLTKTLPLIGEETVYNIANLQTDDKCDWDYDSDGIIDLANVACGTLNYTHTSENAKMSVTVTDSFGIKHKLNSKAEALQIPSIDSPFEINPNKWYQFEAYQEPLTEKDYNNGWYFDENGDWVFDEEWEYPYNRDESCLKWLQPDDEYINEENFRNRIDLNYCWGELSDKDANDSLQVFKSVPHLTSSGVKNRIISGFNDSYSWESRTQDAYYRDNIMKLSKASSNKNQDFDTKFAKVIDNEYYFNFMQKDKCLTVYHDENHRYENNFILERCNLNNKNQLFKANQMPGNFGKLSVEHDRDAPTKPENLFIEIDLNTINFNWNLSKDPERNTVSTYQLFKKDNITNEYSFVEQIRHYNVLPIDTSGAQPGETQTYKVVAIDAAGNTSEASTITFKIPSVSISAPPTPAVSSISSDGKIVTLSRPEYNENGIEELEILYFNKKIGSFTDNTFTYETDRRYHIFTYRYKIADNVYSIESGNLRLY